MKNKKTICLAAAALLLTTGLSVGTAMAYFTTYAEASGGVTLKLGSTTTIPDEEVSNWTKHVVIENTGYYDCYVRIKAFAGDKYKDGLVYSDGSGKWSPGANGYWYYSDIVPAGGSTGEIQIKIDNMETETDFNVIVVQECAKVQYNENGEPYPSNDEANWTVIADSSQDSYTKNQEEVGE